MVICVIVGCSNRSDRKSDRDTPDEDKVRFFSIPAVTYHQGKDDYELRKKRRDGFLAAISREDLDINALDKYKICSKHFISKRPAYLYDTSNPDWLPTLHLGHTKSSSVQEEDVATSVARFERAVERNRRRDTIEEMMQQLPSVVANLLDLVIEEECRLICAEQIKIGREYIKFEEQQGERAACNCASTIKQLQEELADCKQALEKLSSQVREHLPQFCEERFTSDSFTQHYTGLPNVAMLKIVFEHVSKTLPPSERTTKLSNFEEFVCVMVKLRTNRTNEDLSYCFGVSPATISRTLLKWLKQMDIRLRNLILWPDRDALWKTMPECFRRSFGTKVAVIIDCFEIFIERPSNLKARAITWSNYKHHNTIKVLLGITPQGVISFVSDSWGGRVSDKHLTQNCGILKKLLPGDVVLADRGFDIADSVGTMQASLHIPSFTKGKDQLSALEIEDTRTIANVRIHVERVIGCVRQKFSILQSTLPIHFLIIRKGEEEPLIDHIIRICCALNNLCNSVVPVE